MRYFQPQLHSAEKRVVDFPLSTNTVTKCFGERFGTPAFFRAFFAAIAAARRFRFACVSLLMRGALCAVLGPDPVMNEPPAPVTKRAPPLVRITAVA